MVIEIVHYIDSDTYKNNNSSSNNVNNYIIKPCNDNNINNINIKNYRIKFTRLLEFETVGTINQIFINIRNQLFIKFLVNL